MQGLHNFTTSTGNTFKMALYTSTATLDGSTTAYSSTNEITGTGYTAGGNTLVIPASMPSLTTTTAWTDFNDTVWSSSTITNARGALIYNSTSSNKAVVVLDFGADKSSSAGDFTVVFPAAAAATAIIRIA
jgi:hypothetical protein